MRNLIILILCILSTTCFAQSYKLFTTDQHLSSSLINNIYEDSNGMIWVATEDGLNRYDGSKFTIYKHNPNDDHSLAHNYVCTIFEDSKGHLFIGSYGGLQMYDRAKDNFTPKALDREGNSFYNNVSCIIERKNGELWISGDYLSYVTIEGDRPIVQKLSVGIPSEMADYMIEDNEQNVWISKGEEGIYFIKNTGETKHYQNPGDGAAIINFCKDDYNNIYAASINKGLAIFDKEKDNFIPVPTPNGQHIPIKELYMANSKEIFLGTDGKGVKIYNTESRTISDYTFDNGNFDSNKLKIHSILKDRRGNLWFAVYQKGIVMLPQNSNKFNYIGYKSTATDIIGSSCITSIHRGKKGTLWVGTDNDGIYGLTPDNQQLVHFAPSDKEDSAPAIVITVFEDSEGTLWYGSFTEGMGKIDTRTGKNIPQNDLLDNHGKKVQRVYAYEEDNNKRMWVGTLGYGLYYYDMEKKQTIYNKTANQDLGQWICCLHYSDNNLLYVGTYKGLYTVDLSNNFQIKHVLSRRIILNIYEDEQGRIWAGGSDGLSVWDPHTRESKTYSIQEGLPSNTVYAIQGDDNNRLWISTNSGLSQFDIAEETFNNYVVGDGLQGNEFSKNSTYKDPDGTLWFGGINGITYFKPNEITATSRQWDIRITDFYLQNQPVRKGMLSGGKPIIDSPVYEATEFHLAHNDNTFAIEFAAIDYDAPERLNYAYSINDGEWIFLPNGINRYPFYNQPAGTYHFKVKSEVNGIYSEEKEVIIHISPVWWASTWAKLLYVLIILAVIAIIIIQARSRYRSKQQMLEHIHAEEIKEAKLQFFTNISHEIRTPISFIINPIQKLMSNDQDPERKKIYHTIYRNSERILRLINQLMDLRKIDNGKMRLEFQETEVVNFIDELCESFTEQAKFKNITLEFHHNEIEKLNLWVDPYNFDKILMNLISNAFKFTPESGKISIDLRACQEGHQQYAEFVVSDTGPGIAEEEIGHIFKRFYQTPNKSNRSTGTGIGLHLTQSLVELHHGSIVCQNNTDGPGCRFIVRIPIGNEHLSSEELSHDKTIIKPFHQESYIEVPILEEDTPSENKNIKHHILVVEDNDEIRRYLSIELSSKFHVKVCSNGKEALNEIFKKNPDLVISDVMMPEMDGFTLCRKIKTNINLNHIPVILLTAKVEDEDKIEALEKGADAYITKPFNSKILEKTIYNLILSREKLKNTYAGHQSHNDKLEKMEVESPDDKLMARIMKVINNNLSNPNLTVEMIANEVGTSRVHLNRKLKELTNQTAREFIKNSRLKQAAQLLSEKKQNINEIAEVTGFTNPNNFSTAFKELFGVSPSAYKEHIEIEQKDEL